MRISDWSSDVCSSDLTGLPPTPEDVEAFVNDTNPNAYEHFVDKLLASERYGEHRARYWLDAARYAEIGRASCRERVLSVRVDLGGRRNIKKKKNDQQYVQKFRAAKLHKYRNTM